MKRFFKILGCIAGAIALFFIIFVGIAFSIPTINNADRGVFADVLKIQDSSAPKALVVFQPSLSNNSTNIAKELARGLNESGYEVTLAYPGKHLSNNISQYSVVAFGSAVYFGKLSTALTNYAKSIDDFTGKKIIAYSVGQLDDSKELEQLEESLNGAKPEWTAKFTTKGTEGTKKAYELGLKVGKMK